MTRNPNKGRRSLLSRLLRRRRPPVDVLVLKKRDCPLCDEVLEDLLRWRRRLGLRVRSLDITEDADLRERYGSDVPVTFVAGRKRFTGRIDPVLLRRLL